MYLSAVLVAIRKLVCSAINDSRLNPCLKTCCPGVATKRKMSGMVCVGLTMALLFYIRVTCTYTLKMCSNVSEAVHETEDVHETGYMKGNSQLNP